MTLTPILVLYIVSSNALCLQNHFDSSYFQVDHSQDDVGLSSTNICVSHLISSKAHQLRVHLQFLGHPIANDPVYSSPRIWVSGQVLIRYC